MVQFRMKQAAPAPALLLFLLAFGLVIAVAAVKLRGSVALEEKRTKAVAAVQQAVAVAHYFPADARAPSRPGLPYLEDDRKVSHKPPLRPIRDAYNAHTPLPLVDQGGCLVRARNCLV